MYALCFMRTQININFEWHFCTHIILLFMTSMRRWQHTHTTYLLYNVSRLGRPGGWGRVAVECRVPTVDNSDCVALPKTIQCFAWDLIYRRSMEYQYSIRIKRYLLYAPVLPVPDDAHMCCHRQRCIIHKYNYFVPIYLRIMIGHTFFHISSTESLMPL